MWIAQSEELNSGEGVKFFIELDGKPATFANVLHGWQKEGAFRAMFNALLANSLFSAYKWETPCVTLDTLTQRFEFVLLNSPSLARRPNPDPFAAHFKKSPEEEVVAFLNLSGDARLLVPRMKTSASAYGHLAAFVRTAPEVQQHALWQRVAEAMFQRVSAKPVWLSTAGGGVSWLHVRLDDWPKYYGFDPYRHPP